MDTDDQGPVYVSGECEIDLARREVRVNGSPMRVGARAFEIIEILTRSAGELVTKDALMSRVWPGAIVTENTLAVHTGAVRKALGPYRGLLKTESGRGYRLVGEWTVRLHPASGRPFGLQPVREVGKSPVTNFSAPITRLVGRRSASARLQDLISAYRVVTLTGPGGIGKTSLALKVARHVLGDFPNGGWLVDLASLSDPERVPSAAAQVLGLKLQGERITADLVARSVASQQLLLVLDNCEHVIDAAAELADNLARVCPRVTILVTSREALRIDGESVYRLPPLDVPAIGLDRPEDILDHSAVELFIARARELAGDFSSRADSLRSIATICRHLDGLPLAIEFAAARAATLGIELIASGLGDRFTLLTSGRRNAVPRHRTLLAALEWSYALLSEQEQSLLRRLAVFAGGFRLDAALAVASDNLATRTNVADILSNLVAKSLLVLDATTVPNNWRMLETIRAYAHRKLVESGDFVDAAARHARFFRDLFGTAARDTFLSPSIENIETYTREMDNARIALDWCFSPDGDTVVGLDLTAAYAPVCLHLALMAECRERCESALSASHPRATSSLRQRMRIEVVLGIALQAIMAPADQTKSLLLRALDAAILLDDADAQARVLWVLSGVYFYREEYGAAWSAAEQLREVARRIGNAAIILGADRLLGIALLAVGRVNEARQCLEHALQTPVTPGDRRPSAWHFSRGDDRALTRAALARGLWLQGLAEQAFREAEASLEELRGPDRQLSLCRALYQGICRIALMTGDLVTADRTISTLIHIATTLDAPFLQTVGRFFEGRLLFEKGEYQKSVTVLRAAFDTCEQTGWRLSDMEFKVALAEALGGLRQIDDALNVLGEAVAGVASDGSGQIWFFPELLRVQGELLLLRAGNTPISAIEDCFSQALAVARRHGSLAWELRIALSLARLRLAQHSPAAAAGVLQPVYKRFTEGFATRDLRTARTLLNSL